MSTYLVYFLALSIIPLSVFLYMMKKEKLTLDSFNSFFAVLISCGVFLSTYNNPGHIVTTIFALVIICGVAGGLLNKHVQYA